MKLICFILTGMSYLFFILFLFFLGFDYYRYDSIYTSAPFYVYIYFRLFEFVLPALVFLVFAKIMNKKVNK